MEEENQTNATANIDWVRQDDKTTIPRQDMALASHKGKEKMIGADRVQSDTAASFAMDTLRFLVDAVVNGTANSIDGTVDGSDGADIGVGGKNSTVNVTASLENYDEPEAEHNEDAYTSLSLILTVIACILLAYYVKNNQIYYLPESAGALIFGMVIGAVANLTTDRLWMFKFVRRKDESVAPRMIMSSTLSLSLEAFMSTAQESSSSLFRSFISFFLNFPFVLYQPLIASTVTRALFLFAVTANHLW